MLSLTLKCPSLQVISPPDLLSPNAVKSIVMNKNHLCYFKKIYLNIVQNVFVSGAQLTEADQGKLPVRRYQRRSLRGYFSTNKLLFLFICGVYCLLHSKELRSHLKTGSQNNIWWLQSSLSALLINKTSLETKVKSTHFKHYY